MRSTEFPADSTDRVSRGNRQIEFDDLSPYSYRPESIPPGVSVLNVGWLDAGRVFPVGEVPAGFLEKLGDLCAHRAQARMRGWHSCRLEHAGVVPPYPVTVDIGGRSVALGGAEVRVVDREGVWLAAPDLVYHYVEEHGYLPPGAFIEGVMSGRVAGEGRC